jgi:ATP-binding cassette, subfamily B, bacterial
MAIAQAEATEEGEEGGDPAGVTAAGPPAPAQKRKRRKDIARTIGRTLQLAWSADRRTFVMVLCLSLAPAAIPPVMVILGRKMVDLVSLSALHPVTRGQMLPVVIALGVLATLQRAAGAYFSTRQELFGRRVFLEAQRRFLQKAATADLGHFDNSDWYDRVARVERDISWRPFQMTWAVMGMSGNLVTLLGMLGILFALHPVLVLLVVASIVPSVLIQQHLNRKLFAFWWVETPEDRERTYLGELLSQPRTAKEVRSFNLVEHFSSRHEVIAEDHHRRMRNLYGLYDRFNIVVALASGGALGAAYAFVGFRGIDGRLTAGALTAMVAAFASITQQLSLITQSLVSLDQHATFLDDYFDFLNIAPLLPVPAEPKRLPARLDGGVHFDNVTFTYPGGTEPAVAGLDLQVNPGELVALVGDNGAGKTSLVKLLLRFYDPQVGRVTVGGVDIAEVDPAELRSRIGILFQDYATYELSARENVVLGRAERPVDDGEVQHALDAARAAAVIAKLPKGLDSKVGRLFEGGHDLSGGEWQRLALARLMYRDADIWILDEPTSALDPEAEAAIFAELRENLEGRMGLVRPHGSRHQPPVLDGAHRRSDRRHRRRSGHRARHPRRAARPRRPLRPPLQPAGRGVSVAGAFGAT